MTVREIILATLAVVFLSLATFFGTELLKKFSFLTKFYEKNPGRFVHFHYDGDRKPGMYNLLIRARHRKINFSAIACVHFKRLGVDPFSFIRAEDELGEAVIRVYLGRGPATLLFLVDHPNDEFIVEVVSDDYPLEPYVVCEPHWYQWFT